MRKIVISVISLISILLCACGRNTKIGLDYNGNLTLQIHSNIRSVHYHREEAALVANRIMISDVLVDVSEQDITASDSDPLCTNYGPLAIVQQLLLQSLVSSAKIAVAGSDGSPTTPAVWVEIESSSGVKAMYHLQHDREVRLGDRFIENGLLLINYFESARSGLRKTCK